ncbi:MAG: hypothetical protein SNJ81_19325, partial [Cyanobacteriota bacterium]
MTQHRSGRIWGLVALLSGMAMGCTVAPVNAWWVAWVALAPLWGMVRGGDRPSVPFVKPWGGDPPKSPVISDPPKSPLIRGTSEPHDRPSSTHPTTPPPNPDVDGRRLDAGATGALLCSRFDRC